MGGQWIFGVVLSVVGCSMSNVGVNMQKLSHMRAAAAAKDGEPPKSVLSMPLWIIGLMMVILGSIADLVSFGFADMSLLAPLGAMTLVVRATTTPASNQQQLQPTSSSKLCPRAVLPLASRVLMPLYLAGVVQINMVVAPCMMKSEQLTRRDVACTGIIVVGTVISVAFGNKDGKEYTLTQLLDLYTNTPFVVYMVLICIYLTSMFSFLFVVRRRGAANKSKPSDRRIEAFAYPSLAGTFGAHSVLFAKSSAEIVKTTATGDNQFHHPASFALCMGLVICLLLQIRLLNEGLIKADALFVVPVYQVCWVIMNTIVGMMYFQDYRTMPGWHVFLFLLGVAITIAGVYFLSLRFVLKDEKTGSVNGEASGDTSALAADNLDSSMHGHSNALESVGESGGNLMPTTNVPSHQLHVNSQLPTLSGGFGRHDSPNGSQSRNSRLVASTANGRRKSMSLSAAPVEVFSSIMAIGSGGYAAVPQSIAGGDQNLAPELISHTSESPHHHNPHTAISANGGSGGGVGFSVNMKTISSSANSNAAIASVTTTTVTSITTANGRTSAAAHAVAIVGVRASASAAPTLPTIAQSPPASGMAATIATTAGTAAASTSTNGGAASGDGDGGDDAGDGHTPTATGAGSSPYSLLEQL